MLTTRTLAAALVLIAALACSTNSTQAGFPSNGNHNFKFQGNFNHHNFNNFNHNFNNFHNFNTFHNFNGNHGFNTQFHRPFVVTKPVFVPVFVPANHHNW